MAKVFYKDEKGDQSFDLRGSISTFGRGSDNDCILRDRELSRQHFQIERGEFGFKVVDLESRNGTRVNDNFMNQHLLRPGDRVQVGKLVLTFQDPDFVQPPTDEKASPSELKILNSKFGSASSKKTAKPSTTRPRSGGTTAIHRVRPSQRGSVREEASGSKTVLTGVFAVAGLFIGLIVIIVVIGSVTKKDGPLQKPNTPAPDDSGMTVNPNELALLGDIRGRIKEEDYSGAVQLVESFLSKYPESDNVKAVRKYRREAEDKLNSGSWRAYHHIFTRVKDLQEDTRYAEAIRIISAGLENPELGPYQTKLTAEKNALVISGKEFYKASIAEGEALIDRGDFPAARTHFGRLHRELSGGEEFRILVQAIELHLKSLTDR